MNNLFSQLTLEEDKNDTTCGTCVYADNEEKPECCVCLKYMCKSALATKSTICSQCLQNCIEKKLLKKNDKGQYIHPNTYIIINTCICGEIYTPMSPCAFARMCGNREHEMIK